MATLLCLTALLVQSGNQGSGGQTGAGASPEIPDWIRRVQVGGYVQLDSIFFGQDDTSVQQLGDLEDAVNFRRARVILSGPVSDRIDYRFGLDFGGPGRPSFLDARIDIGLIGTSEADPVEPVLDTSERDADADDFLLARIGRFKQPQSMSELRGSGDMMFLERATPLSFVDFRQTGASLWGTLDQRHITYGISGYRFAGDVFGDVDGDVGYGASARATRLIEPLRILAGDDSEDVLVHLGGHLAIQSFQDGTDRYSATPGVGFQELDFGSSGDRPVPSFLDTGEFPADRTRQGGLELAVRLGSILVESELIGTRTTRPDADDAAFWGAYGQIGWVLTGERRAYNRPFGYFGGLTPATEVLDGGLGAIELAARYDRIDLADVGPDGGTLGATTVGANWYWTERLKFQANVIWADTDRGGLEDGNTTIAALRMQFAY